MISFLFVISIILLSGLAPILITKIENKVFSDSQVFKQLKKDGLSDKDAVKVLDMLKPKVGQPGLPAWESKKRNLRRDEM